MKLKLFPIIFIALILLVLLPGFKCVKEDIEDKKLSGCIKGKLLVKGPCAQFVIQVLEGDVKNASIAANWLDPETNTNYTNVFTVTNYCYFPGANVGDEFYFYFIRQVKTMECIVCHAARATPLQGNEIKYNGSVCP